LTQASFFETSSEQSIVKSSIVEKYFWAWAKIMLSENPGKKIAYIDLFSGPGIYKDGIISTPIRVLQKIIKDKDMRDAVATVFNDRDTQNVTSLKQYISQLPGIDSLRYQPQVLSYEVGSQIAELLSGIDLVPTLLFIDPWGYKGLTLRLIGGVLKNWGCDCIFFFNYNRILPGLSHPNPLIQEHMDALFGHEQAESLRSRLGIMEPAAKEAEVIEELTKSLVEIGGEYVLPFCFNLLLQTVGRPTADSSRKTPGWQNLGPDATSQWGFTYAFLVGYMTGILRLHFEIRLIATLARARTAGRATRNSKTPAISDMSIHRSIR